MPIIRLSITVRSYPKSGAEKCSNPELYSSVIATAPRIMVPPGNAPSSPRIAHTNAAATIASFDSTHQAAFAYTIRCYF